MRKNAGFKNPDAPAAAIFCELETDAAFADPGFTHNTNNATIALESIFELTRKSGRLFDFGR